MPKSYDIVTNDNAIRRNSMAYRKYVAEIGKCELCGSDWQLELHHIIPLCTSTRPELETRENWICVCGKCHARLTNRSLLTKIGLDRVVPRWVQFYHSLESITESGEQLTVCDVLDIFDEYFKQEVVCQQ